MGSVARITVSAIGGANDSKANALIPRPHKAQPILMLGNINSENRHSFSPFRPKLGMKKPPRPHFLGG
jgi:hypothetical protein